MRADHLSQFVASTETNRPSTVPAGVGADDVPQTYPPVMHLTFQRAEYIQPYFIVPASLASKPTAAATTANGSLSLT